MPGGRSPRLAFAFEFGHEPRSAVDFDANGLAEDVSALRADPPAPVARFSTENGSAPPAAADRGIPISDPGAMR